MQRYCPIGPMRPGKARRGPSAIAVALRVLAGPGVSSIDGEAVMFSGTDADWVADIQALADVGVSAVDVRLFSCGPNQSLEGDNMRRFRDGVLARL